MLLVNAVVLLVPVVGIEFARVFERELLSSLERDMRHQAVLVRRFLEAQRHDVFAKDGEAVVTRAAKDTRTRVRVLDESGQVVLDSHRDGPPEGHEPPAPRRLALESSTRSDGPAWKRVPERPEVLEALAGARSSYTRIRQREPSVLLFIAEPIFLDRRVVGAVYVTRSTTPVMAELYRIRNGLQRVLAVAFAFTIAVTLWLTFSITRPLARLSGVAKRIASGETSLTVPVAGTGEVRALAQAFATMTGRLQRRVHDMRQFAADVAHGFKSPLTSLRGAAELLARGAADDPRARRRFLRNIEQDAERLDRLVTRLLELSRVENPSEDASTLQLWPLLQAAVERAETPDVSVVLRWSSRRQSVGISLRGRSDELATAFSNLLDNAVRHSPSGTSVSVEVEIEETRAGRWAIIRVRDKGPGVDPDVAPRLFERFFSTDAEHGTGLGLSIVRAVAESHGGSAELEPSAAPGACFKVRLPVL